ncbi:unnamed protein product [Protopolystoma xenopodis]|uniref:Uncharacterized protein n=1 Tax=Protopolystoma xenopodis TaxID=117903 RepID=A0A3S5AJ18_9PLAT|nr:unnamed protein product [Protopolystoma xenopodis]
MLHEVWTLFQHGLTSPKIHIHLEHLTVTYDGKYLHRRYLKKMVALASISSVHFSSGRGTHLIPTRVKEEAIREQVTSDCLNALFDIRDVNVVITCLCAFHRPTDRLHTFRRVYQEGGFLLAST